MKTYLTQGDGDAKKKCLYWNLERTIHYCNRTYTICSDTIHAQQKHQQLAFVAAPKTSFFLKRRFVFFFSFFSIYGKWKRIKLPGYTWLPFEYRWVFFWKPVELSFEWVCCWSISGFFFNLFIIFLFFKTFFACFCAEMHPAGDVMPHLVAFHHMLFITLLVRFIHMLMP